MIYHNTVINLLLTSVGKYVSDYAHRFCSSDLSSSSLQGIESSTKELEKDVREIKGYIFSHQPAAIPTLSLCAVDDDVYKLSMSATLMQNAEKKDRWTVIGVDCWIECGTWWLLKVSFI